MNAVTQPDTNQTIAPVGNGFRSNMVDLTSMTTAFSAAEYFAKSQLVPKDYQGKPANIIVAWQKGAEIGLAPMQSLDGIAVVNGRASLFGNVGLAIVQSHPDFVDMEESVEGEGKDAIASCTITRKGRKPYTRTFSAEDVKTAGLATGNVHLKYPKDMMLWRARWRAINGTFADAIQGMLSVEEAREIPPEREVTGTDSAAKPTARSVAKSNDDALADALGDDDAIDVQPEEAVAQAPEAEPEQAPEPATEGNTTVAEATDQQVVNADLLEQSLNSAENLEHVTAVFEEIKIQGKATYITRSQYEDLLGKVAVRGAEIQENSTQAATE